jgi:hypothetical protein
MEMQVGITSQINKWANTDPQTYWRWDLVPRIKGIIIGKIITNT